LGGLKKGLFKVKYQPLILDAVAIPEIAPIYTVSAMQSTNFNIFMI